jgi:hypothetical protein
MGTDTDRSGRWSRATTAVKAVLVVVTLLAGAACTTRTQPEAAPSGGRHEQVTPRPGNEKPATASSEQGTAISLVVTDGGLAGVPFGESQPTWVVPGGVAAPDGSAAYAAAPTAREGVFGVSRIDVDTGAQQSVGTVEGPAGLHVAAVEPHGGMVLALAGAEGDATRIIEFNRMSGAGRSQTFEGTLEPEAFSTDRSLLFAARIYGERYHVHVLQLATGEQWPTVGPDKIAAPEDMYGEVVQAALNSDGTQLATLYRDPVSPDHAAFVHLLQLDGGLTVCIDLHPPFGTGGPGTESIIWRDDGRVAVGHTSVDPDGSAIAMFDPASIWNHEVQEHYHAEQFPDVAPPTMPSGLADTPGFRRFVAVAPSA